MGGVCSGLFIIGPDGTLRQKTVNDLPVGRNVDETLRLVKAFQVGPFCTKPQQFSVIRLAAQYSVTCTASQGMIRHQISTMERQPCIPGTTVVQLLQLSAVTHVGLFISDIICACCWQCLLNSKAQYPFFAVQAANACSKGCIDSPTLISIRTALNVGQLTQF